MDNEIDSPTDENSFDSTRNSSSNVLYGAENSACAADNDLGDHVGDWYTFSSQTRKPECDTFGVQVVRGHRSRDVSCMESGAAGAFCHVNVDSLAKLKESTKKLLCLLEDIQAKTRSNSVCPYSSYQQTQLITPIPSGTVHPDSTSVAHIIGAGALRRLEIQTKDLDSIYVEEEEDDCSIYKRLTRKCHCLNQPQYNDFIIHFNEDTKYFTSTIGEIIKNMRILKKFLYMGGDYTKHTLTFLNEGMTDSTHSQRIEIAQACAHADICNVFDHESIVVMYISWPCKYEFCGDAATQYLAATFINKLSQLEEGRRYLKFTSKITNDLKRVIRKKATKLEFDTLESLNTTLNLLYPPMTHSNVTYYCKYKDEGFGSKTLTGLIQFREFMTIDEVFTHLDLIYNMSNNAVGKKELTTLLPKMVHLFKAMLLEFDNSEMNIIITNILNNIISKNVTQESGPKTVVMADTCTEPIKMKNGTNQIPIRKMSKKSNRSKPKLGNSPNRSKQRQPSKKKVAVSPMEQNKSLTDKMKKYSQERRSKVIIVPIEEETPFKY